MTEKEKCFAFYERWYTQICLLPEQDQLQLFKAICEYGIFGRQAELNIYLEAIMVNICISIDRGKEKQENFLRLQREKSLKAVEARRRYKQKLGNPTQPTGNPRVISGNPTQPNNKNKEQEQEQELKQEEDNNNLSEIGMSNSKFDSASSEGEKSDFGSDLIEEKANSNDLVVQQEKKLRTQEKQKTQFAKEVVDYFNQQLQECKSAIKPVIKLTDKRKHAIIARAKEYGADAPTMLKQVIQNAANSQFLNGNNAKGWMATFDWIMLPNNFVKVLEGNYNDNNNNQTTSNYGTNNWQQDDVGTGCNNIADRRRRDAAWAEYAKRRLSTDGQSEEIPAALQDF